MVGWGNIQVAGEPWLVATSWRDDEVTFAFTPGEADVTIVARDLGGVLALQGACYSESPEDILSSW